MKPVPSILWRSLRAFQVFGANTEVGKTVFTTALSRAASLGGDQVAVLKPVSTGPDDEADEGIHTHAHVETHLTPPSHFQRFAPDVAFKTLVQYQLPLSPHLAAKISGRDIPPDESLLHQCRNFAASRSGWLFVETAGGVHSPAPSGTTQAQLYAPLRLPVVLIGDSRLGGISQTISAFESLRMRGYDVETVLLFDREEWGNLAYLTSYFAEHHDVPVAGMRPPPDRSPAATDRQAMERYYQDQARAPGVAETLERLRRRHEARIARLEEMGDEAHRRIWYPFTQQKLMTAKDIAVIDSASGDFFQTVNKTAGRKDPILQPSFDGSASWWTQGLGHGNPRLTLAAAYAAGRYGHVMFAGAIQEPALALAETLVRGVSGRLSRVFYSDNGSTGVEVALKMALRAAKLRYGWARDGKLGVLGLRDSYHGDTIGAMDSAEPSSYNGKIEWYDPRGFWFDYPTVACVDGVWRIRVPEAMRDDWGNGSRLCSLGDAFDIGRREQRGEHLRYEATIERTLRRLRGEGRRFGALILEPVVLGAGGMALVDPLFQRALVNVVRRSSHLVDNPHSPTAGEPGSWTGLPVIFDEVFTGLYRLGRFSSSSFLGVEADVSVHAKLLTGGLVPLCATLASEAIFDVFGSEDKTDALLHGHSYTAHAVGCQVALESVRQMQGMERDGAWEWARETWREEDNGRGNAIGGGDHAAVWSVWPRGFVEQVSRRDNITAAWALGSVLAIHIRDGDEHDYGSNAANCLRDALMQGTRGWNVHCRVLGNCLYIMASQTTTRETVDAIRGLILHSLESSAADGKS